MPAQLEVLNGDLNGRHYLIEDDEFLIGRAPSCDLVIPKRYISREHARIVRKGAEYVIDGLSDTNPVTVEDQPASGHRLADGDEFELCGIRFRWKARGGAVPSRHAGVAMSGSAPDRAGSDKKPKDDSWRDEEPDTVPTATKAPSRQQKDLSESDDSRGDAPTSPRPVKRGGSMTGSTAAAPAKKVVFDVGDDAKDEAEQTSELKASAPGKGKGSVAGNKGSVASNKGSAADAKASGPHGESSNERTAELGKVQDPNDPDYDPFAAVEAKKKKERAGDPAREKLLKALMIVGSLGIVLAVAIVMKVRQKPEVTTVYVTNPITLALNQAVRVDEPFASSDRPAGPAKTRLDGEPTWYVFKGNVCDVEWAVPHVKTRATLIVKAKELGDSEFVLEFPETARRKVFKVVVEGEDPWEAAREKRRVEMRTKSPLELRRLADAHKASGETYEREKEVVRKEANLRLALREFVKAVDAANVLRSNLAKLGTVPPADAERVKQCEEAEARVRADYEEFVSRVLAQYKAELQRGATKVELVAQLKRVLRAIANAGDPRFIRLRLVLEESFQVSYDADGSELNDEG